MSYMESALLKSRFSDQFVAIFSAGGYVILSLLLGQGSPTSGGFVVQLSDGLAFPVGVLFGLPGAIGMGIGVLALDTAQSTLGLQTIASSLSLFALAMLGRTFWRRSRTRQVTSTRSGILAGYASAVFVVVVSCGLVAGLFAWLMELFGLFPFYVSFAGAVVSYTLATAVITPVAFALVRWTGYAFKLAGDSPPSPTEPNRRPLWVVAIATGFWVATSSLASLVFSIRHKVPLEAFERYDVVFAYEYVHPAIFGHGARRAQVLFGAVMLVIVFALLRTEQSTEGA